MTLFPAPSAIRIAFAVFGLSIAFTAAASAQPLANRVLIVYNTLQPDSLDVANFYRIQRGIPLANMCGIASPNLDDISNQAQYISIIRDPIRNCLNAVGPSNILYIVMSYLLPFRYAPVTPGPIFYAVDAFVADIWDKYTTQAFNPIPTATHPYYVETQAKGNYFPQFVSFASYRATPKAILIYSVFRLDGPTKVIAQNLVTNAIATENSGGVTGRACFDLHRGDVILFDQPDSSFTGGDWDIYRAAAAAAKLGLPFTQDNTIGLEFGDPAVGRCTTAPEQTSFYAGWYSLSNYNDGFNWGPGSVGFHVESAGAQNFRVPGWWVPGALQRGITVTSGSVTEPYLQGLPRAAGVYRDLLSGANVGDAFLRNTRWIKWMMLNFGDPLYRPFPNAPLLPVIKENSLMLNPRYIIGGQGTRGTVSIPLPAPPGGTVFNLTSTAGASVPATVTILQNQTSAIFNITSTAVTIQGLNVEIKGTAGPVSVANTLVLFPLLGAVNLASSSVTGGSNVNATVVLNDRAPLGGITVTLQSDTPAAATVPPTVFVAAGLSAANFVVNTSSVGVSTPVGITASYAGAQVMNTLTVNP